MTEKRRPTAINYFFYLLQALVLLVFIEMILVPHNISTQIGKHKGVILLELWIQNLPFNLALVCLAVMLITALLSIITRYIFKNALLPSPLRLWIIFFITLILFFGGIIFSALKNFEALKFNPTAFATDPEGKRYCILRFGGFHGPVLTREIKQHRYGREYEILATRFGPSGLWMPMIRPRNNPPTSCEHIYISETGWIAVLQENRGLVAYNPKTNLGYGPLDSDKSITDISPFILIGPATNLNPLDVKKLTDFIKSEDLQAEEIPMKTILKTSLTHPNPEVRTAAKTFLTALKSNKIYQKPNENK